MSIFLKYNGIMDTANVAADVAETAGSAGKSFFGELKKVGSTAFAQLIGKSPNDPTLTDEELEKKQKDAEEFSQTEIAQLRSRIASMYQSYDALKKKEEKLEEEQKKQEKEFEKLEEINELKQSGNAVNVNVKTAVGKTSAETGKFYGAE